MSSDLRRTAHAEAFAFVGTRLVLRRTSVGFRLPSFDELSEALGSETLESGLVPASLPGGAHRAIVGLDEATTLPPDFHLEGLRVAFHSLASADFRTAGTARQKVEWFRTHRFCSACGTPTVVDRRREAMACPACQRLHFPKVSPAVIVLVQRGSEMLLGRSPHFAPGVYSTLAGFVEPGETLEECVHREIYEEVGVRVANLTYFGSQPHPFPHSLMIGFVAEWAAGEIEPDPTEIEDARWFDARSLPELPHPMSIARALIEDFLQRTS